MAGPERILVGVDGTEASFEACRQALRIAPADAAIEAVAVVHLADAAKVGSTAPAVEDELRRDAEAALDTAVGILGGRAERRFVNGVASDALLHEAERTGADLIVLGSHGHRRLTEILIGGVAGDVLHRARCSVLVTRPAADARPLSRVIVVGTDDSPQAAAAVAVAAELGARLGLPVQPLQAEEDAVGALVAAVGSDDLLVVGSRGLHGMAALASVSERVAHAAPCSVLVVRRP